MLTTTRNSTLTFLLFGHTLFQSNNILGHTIRQGLLNGLTWILKRVLILVVVVVVVTLTTITTIAITTLIILGHGQES